MRIACILDSGYEDSEYEKPAAAFRQANHEVVVIGFEKSQEVAGMGGTSKATIDVDLDTADPALFDALFIPGGYSPDHLRADQRAVRFCRAFIDADMPVFAICHGPQLLITARAVEGRTMTAWTTVQGDLALAGAQVVDQEVVVDRSLVTSRQPGDLGAFNRAALEVLERTTVGTTR